MTKKKLVSIVIVAAMLLSCVSAFAAVGSASTAFSDVKTSHQFYNAIDYVYQNNIMNGVGDGLFAPDSTLTRAMLVTIIYRLSGSPAVNTANPFNDVPNNTWYTNAVKWAKDNGIVTGFSGTEFGPEVNLTREQMAAIMYKYSNYKGIDLDKRASETNTLDYDDIADFGKTSKYNDVFDISEYARTGLHCCLAIGALVERTPGMILPQADATRAEAANAVMVIETLPALDHDIPGMPNPMREVNISEAEALGIPFNVPSNAENVKYFIIDNKMLEMRFTYNGVDMAFRTTTDLSNNDISGMHYNWEATESVKIGHCNGEHKSFFGNGLNVQICTWTDVVPGIVYSLSATADHDLNGFDITAVASEVYVPAQGNVG